MGRLEMTSQSIIKLYQSTINTKTREPEDRTLVCPLPIVQKSGGSR